MSDDRTALDAKMQAYGRERTTGFLLKDYFVVLAEPRTKNGDKPLPHLDDKEHKRLIRRAHRPSTEAGGVGQLFAAGPLLDEQGKRIGGLIILRADSFEDARRIVDSDPHRSSGLWDHTIHRWRVSEGSYTVRVKYSSQSAIVS